MTQEDKKFNIVQEIRDTMSEAERASQTKSELARCDCTWKRQLDQLFAPQTTRKHRASLAFAFLILSQGWTTQKG